MKQTFQASLIPALLISSFSSFAATTVEGGKINFTGSVVAAPCALDKGSESQTVVLGQVAMNKFKQKNDRSNPQTFTIKLVGCELEDKNEPLDPHAFASFSNATITFRGNTSGDDNTLALTGDSSGGNMAQNIGIQILQNDQPVKVNGTGESDSIKLNTGDNEFLFTAAYVATADKVIAGSANSSVDFLVNYQ